MIIFIDADGCPVVDETVHLANTHHIPCVILCDTSHQIRRTGAQTIIVSKGADSVDFALVNRLHTGDIAVTQDYGLAAMCLARGARVLRQDGLEYTQENIDALLLARHTAKKSADPADDCMEIKNDPDKRTETLSKRSQQ